MKRRERCRKNIKRPKQCASPFLHHVASDSSDRNDTLLKTERMRMEQQQKIDIPYLENCEKQTGLDKFRESDKK